MIVLYIGISSVKHKPLMYFIISIGIAATLISFKTFTSLLGYPVATEFESDSKYLYHIVEDDTITVWLIEPSDPRPRAIIIPAKEEQQKAAESAKKKSKDGVPQLLRRGEDSTDTVEFYDFKLEIPDGLKN